MGGARNLRELLRPWSIDVWSLGIVLLEIVLSYPVWLAYKGRIIRPSSSRTERIESGIVTGLLGVTGRIPKKILKLQQQHLLGPSSVANLMSRQKTSLCLGGLNQDPSFVSFLSTTLEPYPDRRWSPNDLLGLEFVAAVPK